MLFAIDLGGTKTLLALIDHENTPWRIVRLERYESRVFRPALLTEFLEGSGDLRGRVEAAGLSLAGPLSENGCQMTNLGFFLDFGELREAMGLSRVAFANDLAATAHGLTLLPPESIVTLRAGSGKQGFPKAVLSLGTGLGQSMLLSPEEALPSEGGHTDFAPQDEEQVRLWRFLRGRFGHLSYERLLTGAGLLNLYEFVRSEAGPEAGPPVPRTPAEITACLRGAEAASPGFRALCERSMALFCEILGAKAGNLALETLPEGGLYLAGGITPHILPFFEKSRFHQAFLEKGRFGALMARIPLYAVTDDRTALWGAARLARRLLD